MPRIDDWIVYVKMNYFNARNKTVDNQEVRQNCSLLLHSSSHFIGPASKSYNGTGYASAYAGCWRAYELPLLFVLLSQDWALPWHLCSPRVTEANPHRNWKWWWECTNSIVFFVSFTFLFASFALQGLSCTFLSWSLCQLVSWPASDAC